MKASVPTVEHLVPGHVDEAVQTFGVYRVRDYFERAGVGHLVLHHAGQRWEGETRNPAVAAGVREDIRARTVRLNPNALIYHPVSTRVNRPTEDDPGLIEPTA
ncbi:MULTISPECIES: hypothetical protein [unclassified Thioalkalivibrio]|uniref:hypothetical protein n=1 Tax=unclassified Thioalkalivibrio TaxID=2621013 RepID=UPI000361CDEF|nr:MULTISPECIES: hypothetical protein [unclassified Thioalkalivibrio]